MGTYINIGNAGFQSSRNGEYVDKSLLIPVINRTLETKQRFGVFLILTLLCLLRKSLSVV